MTSNFQQAKTLFTVILLMVTALALLPSLSNAEVYKWTDKNGDTHYSDKKPNEVSSEKLNIKVNTPNQERSSPQESAQKLDENKAKELQSQAEQLQSDTKKRELNAQCQNIRDNLKTLQENSRIKINENGEIRQMTPEEIESKKQTYTEQLKELCSD